MLSTSESKIWFVEKIEQVGKCVNGYELGQELGRGAFGKVIRATHTATGEVLAFKRVSKSALRRKREYLTVDGRMKLITALDKVRAEIELLRTLSHENLVPLKGVIDDEEEDTMYLALELQEKGQIMEWDPESARYRSKIYPHCANGGLSEDVARRVFRDVVNGLAYLHGRRIIHRDIKPDNLLVNASGRVKIADFGVARKFAPGETGMVTDSAGTFHYFSPESCSGDAYDGFKTDLWALGITLYALLFGTVPFADEHNPHDLFQKIQRDPITLPAGVTISPECRSMLLGLLEKDPNKRLTLEQIQSHPWLRMDGSASSSSPADCKS